jgi:DNA helicase II / ATP-dependent DNA helicase PcrA
MAWNDGLEGPALEIAASDRSPLRVVAGPGTGKTFALKRRVARLLEEGVEPEQILLVTFTRMAARDIEKEILALEVHGVERVRKGTLHAFCFSTLNRANVLQATGRTPRPLMLFEERFLLEDLGIDQGEYREDYNHRKRRLKAFEAAWARQQDQHPGWPLFDADRNFQGILNEWMRFHQSMLVGELVPITLKYLRDNPICPERGEYRHVLVDEYQDLNRAEQYLIDLLAENRNLIVVGDEDQSIYEAFRYAHPEGISNFNNEHRDTFDIPLVESRRCPTRIVSMANHLIETNLRRLQHQLLPREANPRGDIYAVQWTNMDDEAQGIAEYIYKKVSSREFDPGKTTVLCTRRQFGYILRDALIQRGIPAHSFFQEELLDGNPKSLGESQAQQAYTLLNLVVNPNDRVALRCWLGFGSPSLRVNEYKRLRNYCETNGTSPIEALRLINEKTIDLPYTTGLVIRYQFLIQYLENLREKPVNDVLDQIFPADQDWSGPFRILLGQMDINGNLDDALKLIRENIIQPELPTDVDYVRIMSLHKSKGLNADHVIVIGCIEGIIPSPPKDDWPFEIQQRFMEEQRRLFYVAITRARKTLVLSSSYEIPRSLAHRMGVQIHGGNDRVVFTMASTFISDLGPECPRTISGQEFLIG